MLPVSAALTLVTANRASTQSTSRYLQHARYGLGISLLRNGWFCCVDQATNPSSPFLFDETDPDIANIGEPIDPVQTSAWSDGVWRRRDQNGVVLVNPVAICTPVAVAPGETSPKLPRPVRVPSPL